MVRKYFRHKLLLDEGVEPRTFFPELNNFFNVRHITHDYKLTGLSDTQVYKFASTQKRIVITYNIKDFKKIIVQDRSGVIGITSNMPTEEIDKKLTALLKRAKKNEVLGKFIALSVGFD